MVSKIMAYEQERELNAPLRGAVMVADNGFETQSAQTSALLPASVAKQSLNRATIGNDDLMRGQLLDAQMWSARNWTVRVLTAAGSVARMRNTSPLFMSLRVFLVRRIGNGQFSPRASTSRSK